MLQQLTERGATGFEELHVVKLYKSFHKTPGTGSNRRWHPTPWEKLDDAGNIYDEEKEVRR